MAKLIGSEPNQVPTNGDLGNLAYMNRSDLDPSTVLQTGYIQTSDRSTYSTGAANSFVEITPLSVTMTPTRSDSTIYVLWMVNGESNDAANSGFRIFIDGVEAPNGRNADAGDVNYNFYSQESYDANTSSTVNQTNVHYMNASGSTAQRKYEIRWGSDAAGNLRLNRTYNSAGQNAYETAVSTALWFEVLA